MIRHATFSQKGPNRDSNQDVCRVCAHLGLFVIADGMGSSASSETASSMAVATVEDFVRLAVGTQEFAWPFGYDSQQSYEHNVVTSAVRLANSKVVQAARRQDQYAGLGSTLVVLWLKEKRAYHTHLGDSRLYLLRQSHLSQLTRDHSLAQEQVEQGLLGADEVTGYPLRHVVTQAIGMPEPLPIEIGEFELERDDLLMLCTDGLTDALNNEAMEAVLRKHPDLDAACQALAAAAREAGGKDDTSVILLQLCEAPGESSTHPDSQ